MLVDAAHSLGARYRERRVGQFGLMTATSFYPTKALGSYGDGGAIFTDDPKLSALLQSLRAHGRGRDRNEHVRVGFNSCLDTIQAAEQKQPTHAQFGSTADVERNKIEEWQLDR